MSDDIDMLPVNKMEKFDPTESARLQPYMQSSAAGQGFFAANRIYLWLIAAFFILSFPLLDGVMNTFTGNKYFTLLLKTIIFIVVVVVLLKT